MDKQTLVKSMEKHTGGVAFINQTQLAKYLGQSRGSIPEMVSGLDYLENHREKLYFVPDVAGRLMDRRRAN